MRMLQSNMVPFLLLRYNIDALSAFWLAIEINFLIGLFVIYPCFLLRAFLHGGGGPKIGEVTCGASLHQSSKRHQIYGRAGYPTYLGSPTFMWTGPKSYYSN